MIEAAGRILRLADRDTKLIPGHGPMKTISDYKEFQNMLITVKDRIAECIKKGMSLQETIDAKPTKDLDEKWGQSFMKPDVFVRIVYNLLQAE
jgi:glyoxylase-like metal-dependent hydrolase (beta-lactamase superfamily II)